MKEKVDNTATEFAASTANYIICKTFEEACDMLASVVGEAALDFETTSLHPKDGRIRITSVCNDDVHFLLDHDFVGPFEDFADYFANKRWYVYNSKFETRWLDAKLDHEDTDVFDVDFMAKAVIGGYPSSLATMAFRDLKITLDKSDQNSDWARAMLTKNQYDYAAFDSWVTWRLKKHWAERMTAGHWDGANVFNDSVRATVEAEDTGLFLDTNYHIKLVELWKRKHATFERYLRRFTPPSLIPNLNSDAQVAKFLKGELDDSLLNVWPKTEKTGKMQMEGAYLRTIARQLPYPFNRWMAALVGYKYYNKYLSTYGDKLINTQNVQGKVTSRLNIGQAATGRYSSSSENLQNIPRKPVVRRSFVSPGTAKSPGRGSKVKRIMMCLADYSGIEVRVLAELSGDKQLIHDAIYSDVHAASAAAIYKDDLTHILAVLADKHHHDFYSVKAKRSKAKGFTFQLTYGAGPGALANVLRVTFDGAVDAINAWAERYPKAYAYRNTMFDIMCNTGYLPVCDGRTIKVWKSEQTLPVAANYPIQAAAASVMYRAMYHVRRRFIEHGINAVVAMTVHDELISYAYEDEAEAAMTQQVAGMIDGWLDIFPGTSTDNLVDYVVGTSWADKP